MRPSRYCLMTVCMQCLHACTCYKPCIFLPELPMTCICVCAHLGVSAPPGAPVLCWPAFPGSRTCMHGAPEEVSAASPENLHSS